jgi:hypothetical protein
VPTHRCLPAVAAEQRWSFRDPRRAIPADAETQLCAAVVEAMMRCYKKYATCAARVACDELCFRVKKIAQSRGLGFRV